MTLGTARHFNECNRCARDIVPGQTTRYEDGEVRHAVCPDEPDQQPTVTRPTAPPIRSNNPSRGRARARQQRRRGRS